MKINASSTFVFKNIEGLLEEIRETIKDRPGLNQAKLAQKLDMSRENFNRILNGVQKLDVETLVKILNCLGTKVLL